MVSTIDTIDVSVRAGEVGSHVTLWIEDPITQKTISVTRTIELCHRLRTTAGSHERFLVIEVFGRYAGFTALLPTMAGAADRCVIPEYPFDVEHLTELMVHDRNRHPSKYAVVLVSEGATLTTQDGMSFESTETDMFGHRKLGGIGDKVSSALK